MNKVRVREVLMAIAIGILMTFLPCWEWSGALDRIMAAAVMSLVLIGNL
jgi:hypothetical protein